MGERLKPYFGRDVEELIAENEIALREYNAAEPREILEFSPSVRNYGEQWAEVVDKSSLPMLYVIAGVCGNMTGVPIAEFSRVDREAAKRYATDFEQGKVFVFLNGARWCDYINAMQATARRCASCILQESESSGQRRSSAASGAAQRPAAQLSDSRHASNSDRDSSAIALGKIKRQPQPSESAHETATCSPRMPST